MRLSTRLILPTLAVLTLAGCAKDALPSAGGPLTQQDTTESVTAISAQLQTALMRATNDEGVLALQGFPFIYNGTTDPLGEVGYAPELPRGTYRYDSSLSSWVLDAQGDDLSLTWLYSDAPAEIPLPEPTPPPPSEPLAPSATGEATLVLDWDAHSPTRTVLTPDGRSVEVPTGPKLTLTAKGSTAADLDADIDYYENAACPAGILEPTSLTLNSTGTFLTLENVGASTTGEGAGATLATQGKVTLTQDDIYLAWDISASGEPLRGSDCFTQDVSVGPGSFATELGGFSGDTRSIALRFGFSDPDPDDGSAPTLSDGAVVINGDESRAVTFGGSTADDNGNGVPGDALGITFPDGSSTTLEALLQDWYMSNPVARLLRLR